MTAFFASLSAMPDTVAYFLLGGSLLILGTVRTGTRTAKGASPAGPAPSTTDHEPA